MRDPFAALVGKLADFDATPLLGFGTHTLILDKLTIVISRANRETLAAKFRVVRSTAHPEDSSCAHTWRLGSTRGPSYARPFLLALPLISAYVREHADAAHVEAIGTAAINGMYRGAVIDCEISVARGSASPTGGTAWSANREKWTEIPGQTLELLRVRCCVLDPREVLTEIDGGTLMPGMLDAAMVEAEARALADSDEVRAAEWMGIAHRCQALLREGHR